jgi:hypothetical protein
VLFIGLYLKLKFLTHYARVQTGDKTVTKTVVDEVDSRF